MFIRISLIVAITFAVLVPPRVGSATTYQFREDSLPDGSYQMAFMDMRSNSSNENSIREGNNGVLIGRGSSGSDLARVLMGVDISAIPSGSTITSITLTLNKRGTDNSSADESHTITVHELVGTFEEDLVHGPSWNNRDQNLSIAWDTPGGDFDSTVLSSYTGNPKTDPGGTLYVFPSSTNFVAAAQNALDSNSSLYLLLRSQDSEEDTNQGRFQFNSDDPESGSPTVDEFPLLTITTGSVPPDLRFYVDRTTGNISLKNISTGPLENVIGYSITSEVGALNPGNWTSIAEHYDANSGGTIDADNNWTELTNPNVRTDLSEATFSVGSGLTIDGNQSIDLGNAWIQNPSEDLKLELLVDDGSPEGLIQEYDVEYLPGDNNLTEPIVFGDLDFDGDVDEDDFFVKFLPHYQDDTSNLSPAEKYQAGDFDENGRTDFYDFFKLNNAYLAANPGASALSLSAVPEPNTLILFALGGVGMFFHRRIRFNRSFVPSKIAAVLATLATSVVFISDARAVKITNLTTGELLFYDDFEISPNGVSSVPYADESGDYDPVVPGGYPGSWQVSSNPPVDVNNTPLAEPFEYDTQVTNSMVAPDAGPVQGTNYLRAARTGASAGAFATLSSTQSTQGDVIRMDLMIATSSDNSGGGGLVVYDGLGYGVIGIALNNDGTIGNRDGNGTGSTITTDVSGVSYTLGEWGRMTIDYEIGASSYSLTYNGVTNTGLPLRYDADVTSTEMRPLSEIDIKSLHVDGRDDGIYVDAVPELELHVNKTTGKVLIANRSLSTVVTDGYRIESDLSALSPGGWDSLDDQEFDGTDTWTQLDENSTDLSEVSFGIGSTLAAGGFTSVGNAYNTGNGAEDLTFESHMFGGNFFWDGAVRYFESGDMNADGVVDELDVPYFIQALTNRAAYYANGFGVDADFVGDFDGNGILDFGDISQFSVAVASASAGGQSTAVPEPASVLMLTVAACCFAGANRRRYRAASNQL